MAANHGAFDNGDTPAEDKSTLSADAIPVTTKATVFRFFDLPRELRDCIYDFSNRDVSVAGTRYGLCAGELRLRAPSPQLLRVSRRFKQKCEDLLLNETNMRDIRITTWNITSSDGGMSVPATLRSRLMHVRTAYIAASANALIKGTDRANRLGQDIASLLAMMPRMGEIRLAVALCADAVEPMVNGAYPPLSLSSFTRFNSDSELFAHCPKERIATFTLRHKLILVCTLFRVRPGAFDDSISHALEYQNRGNIIFFEASASDGPYAWHGLDLRVSGAPRGSFEEALVIASNVKSDTG